MKYWPFITIFIQNKTSDKLSIYILLVFENTDLKMYMYTRELSIKKATRSILGDMEHNVQSTSL